MTVEERNEIFEKNRKLVYFTLAKYHPMFIQSDDAYQEGCIALLEAIERYNPDEGTFATYAVQYIRWYVHKMCYVKAKNAKNEIAFSEMLYEDGQGELESDEDLLTALGFASNGIEDDPQIERIDIMRTLTQMPAAEAYMLYSILHGKTQTAIADEFHTSRQNISRRLLLAEEKFKFFWNKK